MLEAPADGQDGLSVWSFLSGDGDHPADLSLGLHTRCVTGSLQMALYAPFWMINRTGKMLTYKVCRAEGCRRLICLLGLWRDETEPDRRRDGDGTGGTGAGDRTDGPGWDGN